MFSRARYTEMPAMVESGREKYTHSKTQRRGDWPPNGRKLRTPVLVDDDHLARIEVADELGLDQLEGAGLGGDHPAVAHAPERQRPDAHRIAHRDQAGGRQQRQREGAAHRPQRIGQPFGQRCLRASAR